MEVGQPRHVRIAGQAARAGRVRGEDVPLHGCPVGVDPDREEQVGRGRGVWGRCELIRTGMKLVAGMVSCAVAVAVFNSGCAHTFLERGHVGGR